MMLAPDLADVVQRLSLMHNPPNLCVRTSFSLQRTPGRYAI